MADVPVYIVVNLVVRNADEYRKYEKGFFPLLKRYNGYFVTYDDKPEHLEGVSPRTGRVILFGFPSEKLARQWWADPEYSPASATGTTPTAPILKPRNRRRWSLTSPKLSMAGAARLVSKRTTETSRRERQVFLSEAVQGLRRRNHSPIV